MAETYAFQCPNCGSPLETGGDDTEVKCPYCGSSVIVPEELRPKRETPISPPVYSFSSYSVPQYNDEEIQKNISTVGKVVAGVTITSVLAPIILTVVIFCVVAIFVGAILYSVNSTIQSATRGLDPHALQTSISATMIPQLEDFPTALPTRVPPTEAPAATSTPEPTPIPFATPFSKVLFHDNFTTKKGWSTFKDDSYTLGFVKGGYRIFIEDGSGGQTSWLDSPTYKDINITAAIKYVAGPKDGVFGITCRVKKSGFYSFEFSPSGWFAISKYASNGETSNSNILAEATMDTSAFSDEAIYHLRGDCIGHTLTLYINDEPKLQVEDPTYSSGGIGVIASTGFSSTPGVDVLFTDYSITGAK